MFRSLVKAPRSYSLTQPTLRSTRQIAPLMTPINSCAQRNQSTAAAASTGTHAISNPTLAGIEKRWEQMAPAEQAELWMQLRDRMTADWHTLTTQEKKASYYIAFGNHGPRALPPPGENRAVFFWTLVWIAVSGGIFIAIRGGAKGKSITFTKEWQEATNEYLLEQKSEPITGISSEGYEGKGYVQAKN